MRIKIATTTAFAATVWVSAFNPASAAHLLHEPPPAPGPESWTFRDDLAKPAAYHAREAYVLDDGYGLEGALSTVKTDLARFFASAGKPPKRTLRLRRAKVAGGESYRIDIADDGSATLSAEDDDGELKIYFSNIRQMMSSAGSLDSDTPFVLDGNRVLFPSGGDWTLSPEEGAPDNLYGFVDDVDENGIRYISVSKNISVLTDDMSGEELPRIYSLVLKSEALCVDYSINCQMGDDRSWKLSLAEENDGEEN